ncbi:MAG: hypothetical protein WBJ37_07515, partial [Bacteroidales bacterium]
MAEYRGEVAYYSIVFACTFEFSFVCAALFCFSCFVKEAVAVKRLLVVMVMRYYIMKEDHHPCQQNAVGFYFSVPVQHFIKNHSKVKNLFIESKMVTCGCSRHAALSG